MSRQEDFQEQAKKYANECGGTTQEKCAIMTDYFAGAEHGYQYAVEKACEWLESMSGYTVCGQKANLKNFRKAMEE